MTAGVTDRAPNPFPDDEPTMNWQRWTTTTTAALVLSAAAIFWWRSTPPAAPADSQKETVDRGANSVDAPRQQRPFRCAFEAGARLAYTFDLHAKIRATPSALVDDGAGDAGGPTTRRQAVEGQFRWRVLPKLDGTGSRSSVVVAQFGRYESTDGGAALTAAFSDASARPVLLKVDRRCRVRGIAALPNTPDVVVRQWQLLLGVLEVVGPRQAVDHWRTTQRDSVGEYLANYRLDDDGAIERRRRTYLEVAPPTASGSADFRAQILQSSARIVPDANGRWMQSAAIREGVELRTGRGALFIRAETRLKLARTSIDAGNVFWDRPFAGESARWRTLPDLPAARAGRSPADDAPASGTDALAALTEGIERDGPLREAVGPLVSYLRRDPEYASELLDRLASDAIPDGQRSALFFALQEAGTDQARQALVAGIDRRDLDRADRLRAISAASDVAAPDDAVVEALEEAWSRDGAETMEARSSLLAMGHLQGRTEVAPRLRERSASTLARALAEDAPAASRVAALEAVGNGGEAARREFGGRVRTLARSRQTNLRRTAHETLRRLDVEAPGERLVQTLESEPDAGVRREVGRRLATVADDPSPAAIEAAALLLASTPHPDVRLALVDFLGPQAASDPRARGALIDRFRRSGSPELLVRIGRHVPAEKL